MRASTGTRTRRTPSALLLGLLALAALLGACKDNPIIRDPGDLDGTWILADDKLDAVYLSIDGDAIETWVEDEVAGCFERTTYAVAESDGDDFRIESASDTLTIELRRDGDDLIVSVFGESERYVQTGDDPNALTVCGPVSPGVVCAELPGISVGSGVEGALSPSDPTNPDGSHRDLYRLDVSTEPALDIDMSSTEVDSYLVLYDEGGAVVEENDDRSSLTFDARLTPEGLAAGCYIILASSSGAGEVGDYQLTISLPD